MLFTYKYVEHNIALLQKWVDFLFVEVWCNAHLEYDFTLFDDCPELKEIVLHEEYKQNPKVRGNDYITGPIRSIFDEFKKLKRKQRTQIRNKYLRAKDLESVCNNEKLYSPLSVEALNKYSPELTKKLTNFYIDLYEHALDLAVIRKTNGNLSLHYKDFVKTNDKGLCAFCGLSTIRSYEMEGHEAYDHYLPKENYPLYAINFKNLVPTCSDCNTIHKARKIPILKERKNNNFPTNIKRKAFFPYSAVDIGMSIKIKVTIKDYKLYGHNHLKIQLKAKKNWEKLNTWKEIYNIEKRYKDLLTNFGVGKYWLVELLDEMNEDQRKNEVKTLTEKLSKSEYRGKNFIRIPFLLACKEAGLLE